MRTASGIFGTTRRRCNVKAVMINSVVNGFLRPSWLNGFMCISRVLHYSRASIAFADLIRTRTRSSPIGRPSHCLAALLLAQQQYWVSGWWPRFVAVQRLSSPAPPRCLHHSWPSPCWPDPGPWIQSCSARQLWCRPSTTGWQRHHFLRSKQHFSVLVCRGLPWMSKSWSKTQRIAGLTLASMGAPSRTRTALTGCCSLKH
jgi:hypothetical protein